MSLPYLEIAFRTGKNRQLKDILIAELGDAGFESFVDEKDGFLAYIPEPELNEQNLLELINRVAPGIVWEKKIIPPQNWNAVWEAQFDPIRLTENCVIRAPFHPPVKDGSIELIIEPKMSFGTGHHATTRMMCKAMFSIQFEGKKVLDMGCGTGVLGILAAKLGASSVTGIDIEEWAVENAIENAGRNDVSMEVKKGGAEQISTEAFDIILANINRNILLADSHAYAAALKNNGYILLSGFLETDVSALLESYVALGFTHKKTIGEENWRCILFLKR